MSKAFDTVNRELLFQNLENILQEDELHILSKITNNPEIKIKLENKIGKKFTTYHGIMQGDCLSAVLFIYYLACALKEEQETTENKDHNYCKKEEKEMQINPKYADDITYITTSKATHQNTEKITSERLSKYNLMVNDTKTEIYQVPEEKKERPPPEPVLSEDDGRRNLWSELDWVLPEPIPPEPPPRWKECKLLGSKLGTENDIANRKGLTIGAMTKFRRIFKTKLISTAKKNRVFLNVLIPCSIFGLLHLLDFETQNAAREVSQFLYAIFFGFFCGALLLRTNKLIPLAIMHGLIDFVFGFSKIMGAETKGVSIETIDLSAKIINAVASLIVILPLFIIGILVLRKVKKEDILHKISLSKSKDK